MARVIERGNVLGFVLVGALLVALLLGGIYVVRHISTTGSPAVPATTETDTSTGTTKDEESASSNSTTQGSQKANDDQDLKQALEAQSAAEKKAKDQQAASSSANSGSAQTSSSATSLPATGPEEALLPAFGAMLLAGTVFAYARSRRLI